ncbi:MAG: hypothetical protein JO301_00245, partial [Chitinophagaceae bacterium]|nr:hypothetical protein [Chitinophagaceae bacterium]
MNDLHYIAIGLSTALLGFLVWKETSRPNKARIGLRIIANVLTVAGLLCLILPLQYRKDLRSDRRTAIVLTPGFSEDSVNAFIRTISAAAPVYVADNTLTEARKFRPQLLDSREQVGSILHVFGQGLPRETLQTLAADSIVFHPSLLTGITGVHWNTKLFSGEKLVMTGTYHNPSGRPLRIALSSYRSVMDSATIPAKT